MKKLLSFLFALTLLPSVAMADAYDLANKSILELPTLSAGSIASGDYVPVYDASALTVKKVDATALPLGGAFNGTVGGVTPAAGAFTTITATGDVSGDGGDQLFGFRQDQVTATATTLTVAQCGKTFINAGAIEVELPEASTALGCRYTFIVGNASAFTIDPDAADQIVLLTNAAGDSLIADAIGESLTLEAISASAWAPVGAEKGTWTDSN